MANLLSQFLLNLEPKVKTMCSVAVYIVLDQFLMLSLKTLMIKGTEIKSSANDPLPAYLVKENIKLLIPYLRTIVNLSLSSGSMDGAKLAHITPLAKNV